MVGKFFFGTACKITGLVSISDTENPLGVGFLDVAGLEFGGGGVYRLRTSLYYRDISASLHVIDPATRVQHSHNTN